MKILIIEDEENIAKPIQKFLTKKGFVAEVEFDGASGLKTALINEYSCILLDLNLPGLDGIEIANKLKTEKPNLPIIMLTARSQVYDKLTGFETGADDYVTKPFDLSELFARIKAVIKRYSVNKDTELKINGFVFYPERNQIQKNDSTIKLTEKESKILEYLLRNKGRAVSAEELLEHNWDSNADFFTDSVKTHIKTLRKKVDPNKKYIKTIRNKGYIINE